MGEKRVTQQVASDEIYNDDWFLKDSILHDTTKVQPSVIKEYVNQGMATSQDLADEATARQQADTQLASGIGKQMSNLADFYDTTKSYVVGDVCMLQSGELMRCSSPTSGSFDNTKWEQVTVDELFDDLNFSADAISYDNTSSGLEAENVQDAIDETITKLSAVGSASGDIATFTDGSDLSMPKLEVAIEPVQDLHGYDSPWVGGAGKNKLENKLTTRTYNGVTATVKEDGTVTLTGTATVATNFFLNTELNLTGNYTISGCPSGGSEDSYYINALIGSWGAKGKDTGNGIYSDGGTITNVAITVANGYSFPSGGITFKPMIESGNTKTTYEPYSNICPISGWDEVNVTVADDVETPTVSNVYTLDLDGTRYGGKVDLVSGVLTVTHGYLKLTDTDYNWQSGSWAGGYRYFTSNRITEALNNQTCQSSIYKKNAQLQEQGIAIDTAVNSNQIDVRTQHFSSLSSWKTYLASNPVDVRYELATPLTIQLTPTVVKSLQGINNVWADTGEILDAEYIRDLTTIIDYILEQLGN